jgi:hypothetical protein
MATAKKTKPALWARAKAQAKAKMGGKHSARAMQLATKIYKKAGLVFFATAIKFFSYCCLQNFLQQPHYQSPKLLMLRLF